MELRLPADRLRSRDLPVVCAVTGVPADHAAPVVAGGEQFLVPVSRAAVRRDRASRRRELATYAGGLVLVALVTMALTLAGARPPGALVLGLLVLALAAGAVATLRRRRAGLSARRDGNDVVLTGLDPAFVAAVRESAAGRAPSA